MVQVWHCVSIKAATVAECTLPSRVCVLFRVCVFKTVVEDLLRSGLHKLAGRQVQVRPFCKAIAGDPVGKAVLADARAWRRVDSLFEEWRRCHNAEPRIGAWATALATQRCWKQSVLCEARHLPRFSASSASWSPLVLSVGIHFFLSPVLEIAASFPLCLRLAGCSLFSASVRVVSETSLSVLCGREC